MIPYETTTGLPAYLQAHGQRVTQPRRAVFEHLRAHHPCTTGDLVAAISAGSVDRASVYRTLTLFEQLGIITHVVVGGRRLIELTDRFGDHHHHLTCLGCGQSLNIDSPALERGLARLAKQHGYEAVGHQLEITGYCPDCQTNMDDKSKLP